MLRDIANFWLLPFWLAAVYQLGSAVYYLNAASRQPHRTGVEPFFVWNRDCLTDEGLRLRRRATRALGRYILIMASAFFVGWIVDSWLLPDFGAVV
jgi:hypothetical protein